MSNASVVDTPEVRHRWIEADGTRVFYRETGPADAPTLLLLHGFPSGSHQFRGLMARLGHAYHLIAPDLPGFGFTEVPDMASYGFTFDRLAKAIDAFVDALGLERFALYVFDFGAPVGLRMAAARPERITALISQNGNAYEEGLTESWGGVRAYWADPSPENREAVADALLHFEGTRWQYLHGVSEVQRVAPESYTLDALLLERPGVREAMLDLIFDYRSNLALYPRFQQWLRTHRPPTLAIWGRNDPFFAPAGAEAFARDVPRAEVELLDTGHFALETHAGEIAARIHDFLSRSLAHAAQDT